MINHFGGDEAEAEAALPGGSHRVMMLLGCWAAAPALGHFIPATQQLPKTKLQLFRC